MALSAALERLLRRAETRAGSRGARAMVPRRACSGVALGGASLVHLRKVDYGAEREALEVAETLWRWEAAAVNLPFDEAELVGRRDSGHASGGAVAEARRATPVP